MSYSVSAASAVERTAVGDGPRRCTTIESSLTVVSSNVVDGDDTDIVDQPPGRVLSGRDGLDGAGGDGSTSAR